MISEVQRLQYLDAMGIEAWISRERASARAVETLEPGHQDKSWHESPVKTVSDNTALPGANLEPDNPATKQPGLYEIGPGSGQTLLLCARREDTALPIASDIARCLDEVPVWGWLAHDSNAMESVQPGSANTGLRLERAIKERLFTRVLLFSNEPTANQAGKDLVLGSARIIHAPPLAELASKPAHKRTLWLQLTANGWSAPRAKIVA